MFQQQDHHHTDRRPLIRRQRLVAIAGATLIVLAGAGPAAARPDAGPALAAVGYTTECPLERVGTQFVRCDVNTGNGVPAPAWIPER